MALDTEQVEDSTNRSQADFESSPWADSSWEIVGEVPKGEEFFPMKLAPVPGTEAVADPMFADFGGRAEVHAGDRWHLPEHLGGEQRVREGRANAQEEAGKAQVAEFERQKAEAFEQGQVHGRVEAEAAQAEKLEVINASLQTLVQDMKTQLAEAMLHISKRASQLAVEISKKIIDSAVEINPEYIANIVQQALPLAGGAGIRKVRVSPQDMEFIEVVGVHRVFKDFDESWAFEADPTIRAGCIVETSAGEIDFDLDHAFDRLKEKIVTVSKS